MMMIILNIYIGILKVIHFLSRRISWDSYGQEHYKSTKLLY